MNTGMEMQETQQISYHHHWEGFRGQVWKPASPNPQAIHRCLSVWSDGNSLVFIVLSDMAQHYTLKNWRIWENVTCSQTIIYNVKTWIVRGKWAKLPSDGADAACGPVCRLLCSWGQTRRTGNSPIPSQPPHWKPVTSETQTCSLCSVLLLKTTFLLFKPPVIQYQPHLAGLFFSGQDTPQVSYFLLPSLQFHQCENKPLKAFWGGACSLWDAPSAGVVVYCSHAPGWQGRVTAGLSQVTLYVTLPYKDKSNLWQASHPVPGFTDGDVLQGSCRPIPWLLLLFLFLFLFASFETGTSRLAF